MSACFYPPLASIPCDFATGYRRLPGFRPGDNPEVISSPVGLVPTNASVYRTDSLPDVGYPGNYRETFWEIRGAVLEFAGFFQPTTQPTKSMSAGLEIRFSRELGWAHLETTMRLTALKTRFAKRRRRTNVFAEEDSQGRRRSEVESATVGPVGRSRRTSQESSPATNTDSPYADIRCPYRKRRFDGPQRAA
jgi:hypothetical protein